MNRLTGWTLALVLGASMALQGGTKLSKATINGDLPEIKARISEGEKIDDIDETGWTALMWALFYNHDSIAKWLLNNGADPRIPTTRVYHFFPIGTTALTLAAYNSDDAMVEVLLAAKADPNATDTKGKSPKTYAIKAACEACLALLEGKTPPPTALHSSTHRVIKENLNDLFVLLESSVAKSQYFLQSLKNELDAELEKHHVRHLVCFVDPENKDGEKEIAAQREAFKPKYFLQWSELTASISRGEAKPRHYSEFHAALRMNSEKEPVWTKESSARDSGFPMGYKWDTEKILVCQHASFET